MTPSLDTRLARTPLRPALPRPGRRGRRPVRDAGPGAIHRTRRCWPWRGRPARRCASGCGCYAAAWGGPAADARCRQPGRPAAGRARPPRGCASTWTGLAPGALLPAVLVPIALNAALLAAEALPRGGTVCLSGTAAAGLVVLPQPSRAPPAPARRRRPGRRRCWPCWLGTPGPSGAGRGPAPRAGAAAAGAAGRAGWQASLRFGAAPGRRPCSSAAGCPPPLVYRFFVAGPGHVAARITARGPPMDDLLADFLTETNEGLGALDVALVKLERAPDDAATLSEVFRTCTPSRAPAASSACRGWKRSRMRARTCWAAAGTARWR